MDANEEALLIKARKLQGSKNVNWVGGEPTPYLPFILEILEKLKNENVKIPVVWNSNFYMSRKALGLLDGVVDLWLPDFKYGNINVLNVSWMRMAAGKP